jgi:hypothetical protein
MFEDTLAIAFILQTRLVKAKDRFSTRQFLYDPPRLSSWVSM